AHCTGVDGILDELFDDRCRPLHDLAGRDLVDEIGGEKLDAWHRWIIGWPRSAGVSPAAAGRPRPAVEVTGLAGTLLHTPRRAPSPARRGAASDEAAAARQGAKRALECLAADVLEDDVDAALAGQAAHFIEEV